LARSRSILRRIPILLLVETVEPGLESRLSGLGIAAVIGKPFNLDRVRALVRSAIAV
jgi:AmiR/NasT family two-component response regulator